MFISNALSKLDLENASPIMIPLLAEFIDTKSIPFNSFFCSTFILGILITQTTLLI